MLMPDVERRLPLPPSDSRPPRQADRAGRIGRYRMDARLTLAGRACVQQVRSSATWPQGRKEARYPERRVFRAAIIVASVLLALAAPAGSQDQTTPRIFRSGGEILMLEAAVRDGAGRPITDREVSPLMTV